MSSNQPDKIQESTSSISFAKQNGGAGGDATKLQIEDEETCLNCIKENIVQQFTQMSIQKRLPCTKWIPTYSLSFLVRDLIAGISVGLTAIPQGMAYANVAGLDPQYGLYSTIMPCFIYIVFGGCKDMTLGPTAIMSLMTFPYASKYGPPYAILLCFLSGVLILLASIFRLSFLVDFISLPVTTGFTAAAALTIATAQLKNFFGMNIHTSGVLDSWISVIKNMNNISWPDTILGIVTIAALLLGRYVKNKSAQLNGERTSQKVLSYSLWLAGLSGNAIVVICGTLLAYCLSTAGSLPFKLTGKVGSGLPPFAIPSFHTANATFVDMVSDMGSAVIAVPFISIMETIAIGKAFEKGKGVDATQEMIALGLSNLAGSFLGSMPISGSFTRSAINHSSSVVTPLGGLFTGLLVLMALGFLTSLFYFIPKATLAGLIIVAMIFMVEYSTISLIWRTKRQDFIPLCASFFACLIFGVELGMVIGIAANLCIVLYGVARPSMKISWLTVNDTQKVLYIVPKQNLLFPSINHIRESIIDECKQRDDYSPVVICGDHIYKIDSTTAKGVHSLVDDLKARGQRLYLWKWNDSPVRTFTNYNEDLRWILRYDESIEQILSEPSASINEDESVKEFSNNNSSNEQLTQVPMTV
ncbi:sodium-independent sulfate anion transporter-like isoform X1 [Planococcus citri]|uniref:sodium-independent sulfate anion transporter-like isoform X1 n=1 Tax=Planococcus citri TaxID=170843 RepID=UPI0031F93A58